MDPDANLAEQRALAARITMLCEQAAESDLNPFDMADLIERSARLAELATAYVNWVRGGGFAGTVR